jgi:tetratricopeptide (TPR) repeat protein
MRTTLFALLFTAAGAWALAQSASGATIVIGVNGSAQDCYDAAKADDPRGMPVCNTALIESLTPRDRAATLINRSALKIMTGDKNGGLADCDESIRTFPRFGEAYLNRGVALRALGHPQESIAALDKAIEASLIRPQLAYFDRALAEEDIGDVAGAYHDYKLALELEPGFQLAAEELKRFKITSPSGAST